MKILKDIVCYVFPPILFLALLVCWLYVNQLGFVQSTNLNLSFHMLFWVRMAYSLIIQLLLIFTVSFAVVGKADYCRIVYLVEGLLILCFIAACLYYFKNSIIQMFVVSEYSNLAFICFSLILYPWIATLFFKKR